MGDRALVDLRVTSGADLELTGPEQGGLVAAVGNMAVAAVALADPGMGRCADLVAAGAGRFQVGGRGKGGARPIGMAAITIATDHRRVHGRPQQPRFVGGVGGMTLDAASGQAEIEVGGGEFGGVGTVTGCAEGIGRFPEKMPPLAQMPRMTGQTALGQRRVREFAGERFLSMTGEAEVAILLLQQMPVGAVVGIVTAGTWLSRHRRVRALGASLGIDIAMAGKAERYHCLPQVDAADETMGEMAGGAALAVERGVPVAAGKSLCPVLVTVETGGPLPLPGRRSWFGYAGSGEKRRQTAGRHPQQEKEASRRRCRPCG